MSVCACSSRLCALHGMGWWVGVGVVGVLPSSLLLNNKEMASGNNGAL